MKSGKTITAKTTNFLKGGKRVVLLGEGWLVDAH